MKYFLNNIKTKTNDNRINTSNTPNGSNSLSAVQANLRGENAQNLRDEFAKVTQKSGLIEKFYNYGKNKTGLGLGSNKVEQNITEFENGKVSEEEVKNKISNYKISKENVAQNLGDFTSAYVAIVGYFKWANFAEQNKARAKVKALPDFIQYGPKLFKEAATKKVAILPFIVIAGGMTKLAVLSINQIGSKKLEIANGNQLDKKELKQAKKERNRQVRKAVVKAFTTGSMNALLVPVISMAGGIVGVPAYLMATSGIRYFKSKNDNKDKSFNNFKENLINNAIVNSLFAIAITFPSFKKASYNKVLGENLNKVVVKLKDVKLQLPDLPSTKTAYDEIKDRLLESEKIKKILEDSSIDVNTKINKLTEENIFAVKFKQISMDGSEITSILKEDCPPSRTIAGAQKEINILLNSDKYKVSKLLGVGTVAESYLAKDQSGKEVCIKILKKGIDAEKIQRDKEAFINLITNGTPKDKLTKSQQYLIKNIENLAEGVSKEVDFEHEAKAAVKLRKSTKQSDVVVPIEAKLGVYVMEKAPGISLDTLVKYYEYESSIKFYKKLPKNSDYAEKEIDKYTKKMEALKAKSPDFKDFDLSTGEINTLLTKYIDVLVEQFTKVEKNGKTLHADIHPGNIFINLDALKSKRGKLFTLIDTGNTIDLTKEQAVESLKLINFVKNGNVTEITKYVTQGAILPPGMTQEEAHKAVEKELKGIFFDSKTKIDLMNTDSLFKLTNNVLRKYDIIPNDTQLNLNKAKKSANNSLKGLVNSFFEKKYGEYDDPGNIVMARAAKDFLIFLGKYKTAQTTQETKNLFKMSYKEVMNNLKNPNKLETNSEKYLTYKFKQEIKIDSDDNKIYEQLD